MSTVSYTKEEEGDSHLVLKRPVNEDLRNKYLYHDQVRRDGDTLMQPCNIEWLDIRKVMLPPLYWAKHLAKELSFKGSEKSLFSVIFDYRFCKILRVTWALITSSVG